MFGTLFTIQDEPFCWKDYRSNVSNFFGVSESSPQFLFPHEYLHEHIHSSDVSLYEMKVIPLHENEALTLSWRRPLSYNQMDQINGLVVCGANQWTGCFLYDNGLRHEKVKDFFS